MMSRHMVRGGPRGAVPRRGGFPQPTAPRRLGRPGKAGAARDAGQVAIEYIGLLPVLILIGLCAIQLGLAVYAVQQAGTAARAAARVASLAHTNVSYQTAGHDAISGFLTASIRRTGISYDSVEITVRVKVPSVVPGVGFGTAQRSVTMPRD